MPYQTILVHVDETVGAARRIEVAAQLARRGGGHLVGVATTGVSRTLYHEYPLSDSEPTLALHLKFLRERAQQALAAFETQAAAARLPSYEARLVDDDAAGGISLHGRVADLVVVGQAEPNGPPATADLAPEVVLNSARPVLIVPYAGHPGAIGQRVLLAWDASKEAARALLLALPLLRQAQLVQVVVFDSGDARSLADSSCADPLPFLARHGVQATLEVHRIEVRRRARRHHEVGEALLARAADLPADLLVMGAYGHSRFRETLLGGVTHTVFEAMTIPVLAAH